MFLRARTIAKCYDRILKTIVNRCIVCFYRCAFCFIGSFSGESRVKIGKSIGTAMLVSVL